MVNISFSLKLLASFCFQTEEEKKKKVVRLPVQRSVETGLAVEFKARFTRQPSRDPDAEDPKPGAYGENAARLPVTSVFGVCKHCYDELIC